MDTITGFGKYLFALPFLGFGAGHFMNAEMMASMAPFGGTVIVYLTGIALVAAAVSILIGKMDKLASALLGLMLLIFAFAVWMPAMNAAVDEAAGGGAMSNMMKDIALAGAAWMYSSHVAKDNAVIG